MSILRNMAIKHKLISIIMLACVTGLVLAGAAFIGWEYRTFRNNMVKNLSTQAEMIAENCKASLAFQDADDAKETLKALRVEPSIVFGCIYNKDNQLFATYYHYYAEIKVHPTKFQESGFSFKDGFLTVFKPIVLDGEIVGTVCLRSDMSPMYAMLKRNISIIIAVLLLSSLVAFLMSSRLQKVISEPILSLSKVAKAVSEEKDYSTRAVKQSNDEVGLLIGSFNEMLEQIQQRDTELVDAKEKLEVRVDERTAELTIANKQLTREIDIRKKAEEALRESETRLNIVLNSILTGVVIIDAETHVIVDANPLATKIIGLPKEEIIGKVCHKFICPAEKDRCPISDLGQTVDKSERVLIKGDSKEIPILKTVTPTSWKGHRYFVESFVDITERKRAEEQLRKAEEKYRTQFEGALDAIFVADAETGIIIDCNPAATKLVEQKKSELVGKSQRILHPPEKIEGEFSDTFKQHLGEKQGQTLETQIITKTGEIKDVAIKASLIEVGGKKLMQGIFRDITDRKKAEQALKNLNEKLIQSNQQLQEFTYIASHDLREPTRKITSFGQLLAGSLAEKLNDDERENLNFMIDGADRMQQMIEALLLYSRVTTKGVQFEQLDLNEIIEQLKGLELAVKLEETNGTISVPEPLPAVKGDATQIRQLLQNLISNALKYHKKDALPEVTIRARKEDNGMVRVEVQDNGIGIKREQCNKLFVMFRRLHSKDEYEGTGIGLAVCKRIIERHRGEIGIESTYGQGSTFWFTLPTLGGVQKQQNEPVLDFAKPENNHN